MKSKRKLFKNTTLKQKFVLYFKEKGYKEVESRTGKYKVFECPEHLLLANQRKFLFVGRSGAVRVNYKNSVTNSRSNTDGFKKTLKTWSETKDPKQWVEV